MKANFWTLSQHTTLEFLKFCFIWALIPCQIDFLMLSIHQSFTILHHFNIQSKIDEIKELTCILKFFWNHLSWWHKLLKVGFCPFLCNCWKFMTRLKMIWTDSLLEIRSHLTLAVRFLYTDFEFISSLQI